MDRGVPARRRDPYDGDRLRALAGTGAWGYTVAHYFSFAVFQGQAGWLLATDPLGRRWELFGTSEHQSRDRTAGRSMSAQGPDPAATVGVTMMTPGAGTSETVEILAHQGGWDEMALLLGPVLLIAVLVYLARRGLIGTEQDDDDEDAEHPAEPDRGG